MLIGVLALQGAFIEHIQMLQKLGVKCKEIRQKSDLENIDGIVLPGGESTVQGKLLHDLDMFELLQEKIKNGLPTLATCAGVILLAQNINNDETIHLQTLPVTVHRNGYGRQLGSFQAYSDVGHIKNYPMIFIRAPYIVEVSKDVDILSIIDSRIVGVKYKNQIGLAFHPELTNDTRIHEYFLQLIKNNE